MTALVILVSGCRSESAKGLSDESSLMRLTSGYTEIVTSSAKVPGYWATRVGDGEKFFLYLLDRSYRKGDIIRVDGAFGTTEAAVFDDDTRVYQSNAPTNIFVVWKAEKADPAKDWPPGAGKATT